MPDALPPTDRQAESVPAALPVVPDLGCGQTRCAEACTLNRLGIGQCGTVTSVGGEPDLRRRLMEMGFCSGTRVEVIRRSPFGDPIELRLRGYCLSLRDEQAKCVSVSREDH